MFKLGRLRLSTFEHPKFHDHNFQKKYLRYLRYHPLEKLIQIETKRLEKANLDNRTITNSKLRHRETRNSLVAYQRGGIALLPIPLHKRKKNPHRFFARRKNVFIPCRFKWEEKRRNKELKGVRNGVAARNTRTRKWFTGDIFAGFVFYLAFLGQPQVQKGSRDLAWFRE